MLGVRQKIFNPLCVLFQAWPPLVEVHGKLVLREDILNELVKQLAPFIRVAFCVYPFEGDQYLGYQLRMLFSLEDLLRQRMTGINFDRRVFAIKVYRRAALSRRGFFMLNQAYRT
ncbi:MAG TPA: hypothetical protein VN843_31075, partial [Anaerolineales bacterium]|nr:hypothetical protein [Anaerolineales bacterium]